MPSIRHQSPSSEGIKGRWGAKVAIRDSGGKEGSTSDFCLISLRHLTNINFSVDPKMPEGSDDSNPT